MGAASTPNNIVPPAKTYAPTTIWPRRRPRDFVASTKSLWTVRRCAKSPPGLIRSPHKLQIGPFDAAVFGMTTKCGFDAHHPSGRWTATLVGPLGVLFCRRMHRPHFRVFLRVLRP